MISGRDDRGYFPRGAASRKITPIISPGYHRAYTETEVNLWVIICQLKKEFIK